MTMYSPRTRGALSVTQEGGFSTGSSNTGLSDWGLFTGTQELDSLSVRVVDDDGAAFVQDTDGTANSVMHLRGINNLITRAQDPSLLFKFRFIDTADVRVFIGIANGNSTNVIDDDTLTRDHVGLWYSTSSGDTEFNFTAGDTVQDKQATGIAIDTNTHYLAIDADDAAGTWKVTLYDANFVQEATHTYTGVAYPTTETMRLIIGTMPLVAAVKQFATYFGKIVFRRGQ